MNENIKERQKATKTAGNILGRRMHTCKELFDKLCKKGYSKEVAEIVVSDFISAGYLDDRKYVEMYIYDAINISAKGMYRIRQELKLKGISDSVIDDILMDEDFDSVSALKEYIYQRRLCDNIHSKKDLKKLKARLIRRGYSYSEINACLSDYMFNFEEQEDWIE